MSAPHLSRAADQQRLAWLHGGEVSVLLDGQATDAKATVLRHRFPAGSTSPVHLHTRED